MGRIAYIACALPDNKIDNTYFNQFHDSVYVEKTAQNVGIKHRYWSQGHHTTLSLGVTAANKIFDEHGIKRDEIDLVIFVSQTPDKMMPGLGYRLHEALELPETCSCITVNAGCSGYVEGLALAFDMIKVRKLENVLLICGDTLSKYVDIHDAGTALVFGDGVSATLVVKDTSKKYAYATGTRPQATEAITLPLPHEENATLSMQGIFVFNFTVKGIPKHMQAAKSAWQDKYEENPPEIGQYCMHQANKMILAHIAKKEKINMDQVPINIEKYGNTSGCTIPLLISDLYKKKALTDKAVMLNGFGVGLAWASMIVDSLNPEACDIVFV